MAFGKKSNDAVVINAPNFREALIPIRGTANFVSNNFSEEARSQMAADQEKGSADKARGGAKKRAPKDFEAGFRGSLHRSTEGWYGIPVIAFRAAMVRASSLVGIEMTRAKQCIFIECDGFDREGKGLVRITKGEPEHQQSFVKNDNGKPDIRSRGVFKAGWEATVHLKFDADFLSGQSVVNLLARAGVQVGVGAGRPFSTNSVGQGWGTFEVLLSDSSDGVPESSPQVEQKGRKRSVA
jgi:hypothetical protein